MTYDVRESSAHDGAPVELYEFRNGEGIWRFTSADEDIDHLAHTFVSEALQRSSFSETQELNKSDMKVQIPSSNPIAQMLQFYPPTSETTLTVWRKHRGDSEAIVAWVGRVLNSEYQGGVVSELHCEPVTTSFKRLGLRRNYQRQCPHALYGPSCGVNKLDHITYVSVTGHQGLTVNVVVVAGPPLTVEEVASYLSDRLINWANDLDKLFGDLDTPTLASWMAPSPPVPGMGVTTLASWMLDAGLQNLLIAPEFPDVTALELWLNDEGFSEWVGNEDPTSTMTEDQFAGGMMSWVSPIGRQWRFITGNTPASLSVNLPFAADNDEFGRGLPVGTALELYPGCQHTLTDCINKFNNLDNYGGFPYTPMSNPFGGTTLF